MSMNLIRMSFVQKIILLIDYVWQGVDLATRNCIAYNEAIATRRTENGGGEIKRHW